MKRRYYSAESLRGEVDAFERRYGYDSEEHVRRRYIVGSTPGVSGFDSHVWADVYGEWLRLSNASYGVEGGKG